ncbi:MAG: cation:proton antiporter, partial [Dermabacter sp.]|nr:cation:proton antiporter [Dermabacter sp.]
MDMQLIDWTLRLTTLAYIAAAILFILALVGLTVLVASALFSRRTGIAAPLLLLVLGIVASFTPWIPDVELTNEVVLLGVLPPILFASGRNVPVIELRRNLKPIAWLSIVMVIVPAVLVGVIVHLLFCEISLPLAIALGAAVSPIDAVAATSIGRRLGLPDRL